MNEYHPENEANWLRLSREKRHLAYQLYLVWQGEEIDFEKALINYVNEDGEWCDYDGETD